MGFEGRKKKRKRKKAFFFKKPPAPETFFFFKGKAAVERSRKRGKRVSFRSGNDGSPQRCATVPAERGTSGDEGFPPRPLTPQRGSGQAALRSAAGAEGQDCSRPPLPLHPMAILPNQKSVFKPRPVPRGCGSARPVPSWAGRYPKAAGIRNPEQPDRPPHPGCAFFFSLSYLFFFPNFIPLSPPFFFPFLSL